MTAIFLRLQGEGAQADGWQSRALRLLADAEEGAEHGYPLYLEVAALMGSDLDAAVRARGGCRTSVAASTTTRWSRWARSSRAGCW